MNKILIGRYLPGNSLIHRMDPRGKIVFTILFVMLVFLANNFLTYFALLLFCFFLIKLSRLSFRFFFDGIRSFVVMILIVIFFQLFFTTGGTIYFHWGIFTISQLGIINSFYMFFRLLINIIISTILTLTTSPLLIATSIESLLKPFSFIGVPTQIIGLMVSIALRFIPTIADTAQTIINAQASRGVDFNDPKLTKRVKTVIPLLIPLLESNFKMAEDLSIAMESRGYVPEAKRTRYRVLHWQMIDSLAFVVLLMLTILIIFLR